MSRLCARLSSATVTIALDATEAGVLGAATIVARVPADSPGVVPRTSGTNTHTLYYRPPVPTLTSSYDGTSRTLSVLATFRDGPSPTSAVAAVTGVTVADFNLATTGLARVASEAGAVTVQPVGTSIGWEYAT